MFLFFLLLKRDKGRSDSVVVRGSDRVFKYSDNVVGFCMLTFGGWLGPLVIFQVRKSNLSVRFIHAKDSSPSVWQ